MPSETLRLLGNKINHLQPTVLPKRSVIVNDRGKKCQRCMHFLLEVACYWRAWQWQMLAEKSNKLQVNETKFCMSKVLERRILSNNKFATWKCLLLIFKFFALINLLFSYECLFSPQPTFLEYIVIFLLSDRPALSRWPQLQCSSVILFPDNLEVSRSMAKENISFLLFSPQSWTFITSNSFVWKKIITVIDATFAVVKRKPDKIQACMGFEPLTSKGSNPLQAWIFSGFLHGI